MLFPGNAICEFVWKSGKARVPLEEGGFVNYPVVVNNSSAKAIQEIVENAREGSVIELSVESVTLMSSLSPRKNVTLKGSSSGITTQIGCFGDDPAFLLW